MDIKLICEYIANEQFNASLARSSGTSTGRNPVVASLRATLTQELLDHPGIFIFLDAMGSRLVPDRTPSMPQGVPERAHPGLRSHIAHPEQWITWEMAVPDPKFHLGRLNAYTYHNKQAPKPLPTTLMAVDFDESTGSHRDVQTLWDMCVADGAHPLCAVPSSTKGNWHFWFLLDTPTWKTLSIPAHWGADAHYNAHSLAWNPVHRTFFDNEGLTTIWNTCLFDGEVPYTDPGVFYGNGSTHTLRQRLSEAATAPSVTLPMAIPTSHGERLLDTELDTRMRLTSIGQRWHMLNRYVWRHQAKRCKELGVTRLSESELRAIVRRGNALFAAPLSEAEVRHTARMHHRTPFNILQRNRATKHNATELVDRLVCWQLLHGNRVSEILVRDFHTRFADADAHPDAERFLDSEHSGHHHGIRYLAQILGLTQDAIKGVAKRYKAKLVQSATNTGVGGVEGGKNDLLYWCDTNHMVGAVEGTEQDGSAPIEGVEQPVRAVMVPKVVSEPPSEPLRL